MKLKLPKWNLSILCLVMVLVLVLTRSDLFAQQSGQATPPNIILVMTDDQGYAELSCHGHPHVRTPHIDRLATQSVRMEDFQVSPTCAPTRSALMTGRHEFKNGVTHTIIERDRMTLDAITLPQMLQQVGYECGIFGKWHLGDQDAYQPENRGFDEVFVHGAGGIGQKFPDTNADVPGNKYLDPVIKHNGTFVKTSGFCTDVFFTQALGWINQRRKTDQPFFAYIAPNAAHGPFIAPEKYTKRFTEMGMSGRLAGFYGMIDNIDDNMGRLMQKLEQWDLEENTILIFMTDNGSAIDHVVGNNQEQRQFVFKAGMKGHKQTPSEGGTRVPAFFRWKGTWAENVRVETMTAHIDLFPTFAEITGGQLPENGQVKGRSLTPLLNDAQAEWQDRYFFVHCGRWKRFSEPNDAKYSKCAVRNERFRLENNSELYDLFDDPAQTTNVIDQHPEVVSKMRAAYDKWWEETRPMMVNEQARYEGIHPYIKQFQQQKSTTGIPAWKPPSVD